MIARLGVQNIDVEEMVSIDEEGAANFGGRIHGFVLLYKYKRDPADRTVVTDSDLYFANQVVGDACATQARVNLLLNCPDVNIGDMLRRFQDFTAGLDPCTRGEMIGQSQELREVHNSFARPACFSFEDRKRSADDDAYHFVAYTVRNEILWELDGLEEGPVFVEPVESATWTFTAMQAIRAKTQRIAAVDTHGSGQGISFALLAVCDAELPRLQAQLAEAATNGAPVGEIQARIRELEDRMRRRAVENTRRRHSYIPTVIELLRALADKNALQHIVEEAKGRAEAKEATRVAKKARTGN